MMQMKRYMLAAALVMGAVAMNAQENKWDEWGPTNKETKTGIIARVGYTVGGTTPLPVPAEIRTIREFSPKGGFNVGLEAYKMFNRRWGLKTGAHFFYEGFHTAAEVKGYQMTIEMDGESLSGYFTGTDVTNTSMWGMTVPVLANFRLSPRWNVSLGPYVSVYYKTTFEGEVYENRAGQGYLRVDNPTGQKVELTKGSNSYNFGENMRPWGTGVELQFDWQALKHMNVFAQVDWGLSNAIDPDFTAVAFKMYPVYATFGVAYRY